MTTTPTLSCVAPRVLRPRPVDGMDGLYRNPLTGHTTRDRVTYHVWDLGHAWLQVRAAHVYRQRSVRAEVLLLPPWRAEQDYPIDLMSVPMSCVEGVAWWVEANLTTSRLLRRVRSDLEYWLDPINVSQPHSESVRQRVLALQLMEARLAHKASGSDFGPDELAVINRLAGTWQHAAADLLSVAADVCV